MSTEDSIQLYEHEDKILLVLTLIIGAVVGLAVVAFILLTENLGARLYPATGSPWRRLLIPVIGALGTGFFLYRYFPNARGSGIPQTKTALFLRDGYISFRTVLGKFILCSISLASGIALGREGPSVQVGAGIASVLGRKLGLTASSVRALVPAGASAALAAAFNTPISAVLFSLEEVMGDMHAPILGSIVLSSATSWIVLHLLLGDEPLFHVPAYQLVHLVEFVFYAALGVVGGLVSAAFVKLLLWQRKHFLRMPPHSQWFLPGVGGLTVGLLGWFFPDVLGVGYAVVGQALNGQLVVGTMALLIVLKLVATATCYASGNAGGIFGPSLFIGAMMGGAVGGVAHTLMPDYTGSVGAYALVGMGAAFAGIVRVPLTSVIMIFEITRDYSIIVPLMIANLISYFISSKLQEEPIYEALQHQDGIHLPSGARARQTLLLVGHGFRPEAQILAATEQIGQAAASVDRERRAWPVVDSGGLRGMVTVEQLDEALRTNRGDDTLGQLVPEAGPIHGLTAENFPHIHPDHPLEMAMQRIAQCGLPVLPVVSRTNVRDLKGTISTEDILAAYRMGRTTEQATAAGATRNTTFPVALLVGVVGAIVGLAGLAASLNYFYRAERKGRAQHHLQTANELMAKDRFQEAITQYRDALSISHSLEDRLSLALALVKAEHLNDATIYLNEVLRERPQSGPANLGLARVYVAERRIDSAVLQYHRAIYGSWAKNPQENRTLARLELVDTLAKAGRRQQAQAELLSLVSQAPDAVAIRKQLGHMLADLGLRKEAAGVFGDLAHRNREDAGAFEGLGAAEFALEDYSAARDAYRNVLRIEPGNQAVTTRIDVCDRILGLDPTARGLSAQERFRRSRTILDETLNRLLQCAGDSTALPDTTRVAVDAARAALGRKKRPPSLSDATELNLGLAEQLWSEQSKICKSAAGEALSLVLAKLPRR